MCFADGTVFDKAKHVEDCRNPGVCTICHRGSITASTTNHESSSPYYHNDTVHWQKCSECGGTVFNKVAHTAICTDPTTCSVCGATGL